MTSKLLVIALCAYFIAAIEAGVSVSTYSDDTCTTRVGMYQSTQSCGKARSVNGEVINCSGEAPGPYYTFDECAAGSSIPTAAIPEGWQSIKYAQNGNCDFSSYELLATSVVGEQSQVVVYVPKFGFPVVNVTANCDNGLFSLSSCSIFGCTSFDEVPNDVCKNVTIVGDGEYVLYSGLQTSCVAAPTAEMPAAETPNGSGAPNASPSGSNAPTKPNTPSKTSDAVSVVTFVGSLTLVAVSSLFF